MRVGRSRNAATRSALSLGIVNSCSNMLGLRPRASTSRVPQASALRLCSPPLRFVLSASLQGWAIPLSLTLATPDLTGQAEVTFRNPIYLRKEQTQ